MMYTSTETIWKGIALLHIKAPDGKVATYTQEEAELICQSYPLIEEFALRRNLKRKKRLDQDKYQKGKTWKGP